MQIELTERDILILKAIRDSGVHADLTDCLYHLYRQDVMFPYEEVCESFTRLLQGRYIANCTLINLTRENEYRITTRGKAALLGDEITFEEREIKTPFKNSRFLSARTAASKKYKLWQNGALKVPYSWNVFSVLLWILSLAFLAGGIVFACLFQGEEGWRFGVGIAGVVVYCMLGTIDAFLCASKCSNRVDAFLIVVNLPAYALTGLILFLLSGA